MTPDLTYSLENIETWVSEQLSRLSASSGEARKRRNRDSSNQNGPGPKFEAIKAGCAWVDSCSENPQLDEPSWYALGSIVSHCNDGERIFHEISALDSRYDEAQTSEKLEHAKTAAGPRTCQNIWNELNSSTCERCPFRGKITSPISLGYQPTDLVGLLRNHVLDTETGRYLDLRTGTLSGYRAFNDRHAHLTEDRLPHTVLARHNLTRKVDMADYIPGNLDLFVTLENGHEVVNTWTPSPLKPEKGDCSTIRGHFDLMFADATVRKHILDCLAFMFQKPGQKIGHAFVLIGKQGTGKSLLFNLLGKLFGKDNSRTINSSNFVNRFNAQITGVQLLIVEELWTAERRETYNSVKTLITERKMRVEQKHIDEFVARTPDFILASSNHAVPITLEDGDRRFCVYESSMTEQGPEYYAALARAIENEVGAFLHELLVRDISNFDPNKAPPVTETKCEILRSSRTQIEQEVEAMIEEGDAAFWHEVVNLTELRFAISKRVGRLPSLNEVKAALKSMGAVSLNPIRLPSGGTLRLWAWKNPEHWLRVSAEEIRQHLRNLKPNEGGDGA